MQSHYANGQIAWKLHEFTCVVDGSGELGVLEIIKDFDFPIRRMFFLRNIVNGAQRGFHAHEELRQIIFCLVGSFVITLNSGLDSTSFKMEANNSYLELDGRVWREMSEFSEDCLMVVLCDREYSLDKVIRDFEDFKKNLVDVNGTL